MLLCFKEKKVGWKKNVRTLMNPSVQQGKDILFVLEFKFNYF